MTYTEYTEQRRKGINELPLFFAFTNKQLEEQLAKRGLTMQDTDKLMRLGDTGGFYLKEDRDKIREFFNSDPLDEYMKDSEFAVGAFEYEMDNHEYAINYYQGDWDVISCFCKCEYADDKDYHDYLKEGGLEHLIPEYEAARKRHYKKAEEWF